MEVTGPVSLGLACFSTREAWKRAGWSPLRCIRIETVKVRQGKTDLAYRLRISFFCQHLSDSWRSEKEIGQKNGGRKITVIKGHESMEDVSRNLLQSFFDVFPSLQALRIPNRNSH